MMVKPNPKFLKGLGEITTYLGFSKQKFYNYVRKGLPARVEDGEWIAHTDNIDAFLIAFTRGPAREISEDAE